MFDKSIKKLKKELFYVHNSKLSFIENRKYKSQFSNSKHLKVYSVPRRQNNFVYLVRKLDGPLRSMVIYLILFNFSNYKIKSYTCFQPLHKF